MAVRGGGGWTLLLVVFVPLLWRVHAVAWQRCHVGCSNYRPPCWRYSAHCGSI